MAATIGEIARTWTQIRSLDIKEGVRSVSGKMILQGESCWYNETLDAYCKPEELHAASQVINSYVIGQIEITNTTITVTGSVTVTGKVEITNSSIAVTQQGDWNIGTLNQITTTVPIAGSVEITNPSIAVTQQGEWNINQVTTVSAIGSVVDVDVQNSYIYMRQEAGQIYNIEGDVTVVGSVTVSGAVTVSGTVSISGPVTISGDVNITNSTIAVTQSGSWAVGISGAVTVTGTVAISGTVSVTGSVTVSGSVTITSGSVSITGTVTVAGSVSISAGTVNVQTAAGVEVSIGKQDYKPVTRTIQNDGGTPVEIDPLSNNIGKYFPSGMRGWIKSFSIYIKNTSGGDKVITMNFAPRPGAAAVYSTNLTIQAGGPDWQTRTYPTVAYFWDYDSMFVWMTNTNNITLYVDVPDESTTFADYFRQPAAGGSWISDTYRTWYRVTMSTQSHYPVAVEGTVSIKNVDQAIGLKNVAGTPIDPAIGDASPLLTAIQAGKAFYCAGFSVSSLANSTSGKMALLKNPNGSGKTLKIFYAGLNMTVAGAIQGGLFSAPTVTSNGTAKTPQNALIGSAASSIAQAYSGPTVSSLGNEMIRFWGNVYAQLWQPTAILELQPNQTLFFEAYQFSGSAQSVYGNLGWWEE